jgi:hypothetical protein
MAALDSRQLKGAKGIIRWMLELYIDHHGRYSCLQPKAIAFSLSLQVFIKYLPFKPLLGASHAP